MGAVNNSYKTFIIGTVLFSFALLILSHCCCLIRSAHTAMGGQKNCCGEILIGNWMKSCISSAHDCQICERKDISALLNEKDSGSSNFFSSKNFYSHDPINIVAGQSKALRFALYSKSPPIESLQESVPIYLFIKVLRL